MFRVGKGIRSYDEKERRKVRRENHKEKDRRGRHRPQRFNEDTEDDDRHWRHFQDWALG